MSKSVEEVRRELFRNVCARLDKDPGYDTESGYSSPYGNEAWLVLNDALDAVEIQLPELAEGFAGHVNEHAQTVFLDAIEQTGLGLRVK